MTASPSVESCTHKIVSLDPFVLECGHYPDVDFRGSKQVGDRMPCIGCYKGLPTGNVPAPETEVSQETKDLLEANPLPNERCPGCGGLMVPVGKGPGKKAPAKCVVNCYLGNLDAAARERVFAVMREIGNEALRYENEGRESHDRLEVGGAMFDLRLKGAVRQAFLTALHKGENPNRAVEKAQKEARLWISKWNARREWQVHRADMAGDSDAEFLKERIAYAVHSDAKPVEDSGGARLNSPGKVSNVERSNIVRTDAASAPTPRGDGGSDIAVVVSPPRENELEKEPMTQLAATDTRVIPFALEEKRPLLAQWKQYNDQWIEDLRRFVITTPEWRAWVDETVKTVKDRRDEFEKERTDLTRPLLAEKARVDEAYLPVVRGLEQIERILKDAIGAYHAQQRAEQERVMRESAQVYQQGGIPVAPVPVVVSTEGVGVREGWSFEITNAVLVPRELCSPDPEKIELRRQVAMSTSNEPPSIPGIRFFKTTQVRVTRK